MLSIPPPSRVAIGYASVGGQRVEFYLVPEWARYFESLTTEVVTTSGAVGLPGAPGTTGAAGAAISFATGDGDGSVEFLPGLQGAPGAAGPQGIPGQGAMLSLIDIQDAQIEYMPGLPGLTGPQGPQGLQGNTGAAGPAIGFLSADIDPGLEFMPGPQGPQGIQGIQGVAGNDGAAGSPVGFLASEGDAGVEFMPGPQGPQGAQGLQGSTGPALEMLYQIDEPTDMMPAPQSTLQAVLVQGSILSSGISGIGYTVGAGSTVTQATSKATAVALNFPSGQITMNAASLAASTTVSFTLTNSAIAATDTLHVHRKSGGTALVYQVWVDSIAAGSAVIAVRNISAGALLEAVVLQFTVQKGSNT